MLLAGYCGTCNAPDTRTVVLVSLASLLRAPESEEKFEPDTSYVKAVAQARRGALIRDFAPLKL